MFDYLVEYAEMALAWMLFIAIPFLAAGMFYRAWKRYGELRAARATSAPDTEPDATMKSSSKYLLINTVCGLGLCIVFAGVLFYGLAFATWSGSTAVLVWIYFASMRILEKKGKQAKSTPI